MFQFNASFNTLSELHAFVEKIESKPDAAVQAFAQPKPTVRVLTETQETPKLRKGYHQNKGKGWTKEEDTYILYNRRKDTHAAIAKHLGRTSASITMRLHTLMHKDDAKRSVKHIKVRILDDEGSTQSTLLDDTEGQNGMYIAERATETVEPKKPSLLGRFFPGV